MEILHKKGKDNVVVDALSWKDEEVKAYAILVPVPDWLDEIRGEYAKDPDTCFLINDSNCCRLIRTSGNVAEIFKPLGATLGASSSQVLSPVLSCFV